jgi:Excalibur calcium-binding domain
LNSGLTALLMALLSYSSPINAQEEPSQQWDCDDKYCKAMSSCEEAVYKDFVCGMSKLDRDSDGLPCENVCKSDAQVAAAKKRLGLEQ